MALQKTIVKNLYGKDVQYDNCYCQIDSVTGGKENMGLCLNILTSHENGHLLDRVYYSFVPSVTDKATNYHKQGYEYLKTLPEFTDAIDC